MNDARDTPANGRVAHVSLRNRVAAERFVEGAWRRLVQPVADLCRTPRGARDRQLLLGERFLVLEEHEGFCFGQAERDGYVGYAEASALGPDHPVTHRISARASHVYDAADIKSPERLRLSHGASVQVIGEEGRFARAAELGWIPLQHLVPLDHVEGDPVAVAERFLGTPYLWGGNSGEGIDCSGLVQAACLACGLACPRDSDQQQAGLGTPLDPDDPLRRGDLLFWRGHVGLLRDAETLLHANAHHMAVASEPLDEALARIGRAEFGEVVARRRLPVPAAA